MLSVFPFRFHAHWWHGLSLLLVLGSGLIAFADLDPLLTYGVCFYLATTVIVGGALLPRHFQTLPEDYQPSNRVLALLRWITAPQVEAAILLWFGLSILAQPTQNSFFLVTESLMVSHLSGWGFLILAWRMAAHQPNPLEYTLLSSSRLIYTAFLAVYILVNGGPLVAIGAYAGGVLHGVVSILMQWAFRDLARTSLYTQKQLDALKEDRAHAGTIR